MTDAFLESDIVKAYLEDIMDLQMEVVLFAAQDYATLEGQKENLGTLKTLHAKQKNMFFRCMLCDSPTAKNMITELLLHFEDCGYEINMENPISVFDIVESTLTELEVDIRNQEERDLG